MPFYFQATVINDFMWTALSIGGKGIHFKSEQTPKIYDPMSTIVYGYASCTGLLVHAMGGEGRRVFIRLYLHLTLTF
jgi:hypothetical protein